MKKIFSILFIAFVLFSCEDDVKTNTPAFQGEKDNLFWRANDSKVTLNINNTVSINAYTERELVSLTIPNSVGVHTLGTVNQSINATYTYNYENVLLFNQTSLVEGPVFKLTGINNAGTGYASLNSTIVNTTGGSGNGLTLRIEANTAGSVTKVTIATRGTGYEAGDVVTIAGGNANAKVGVLNTLKSNGTVIVEKIEGNLYTGSFSFNAVDEQGNVVNFNKGTFYKVPAY